MKLFQKTPIRFYSDNKATITITHNPVLHNRTKHIEVDKHFINEKIDACVICISYLLETKQIVDILTKGFSTRQYDKLINKLGMEDI